jgi:hypothetical protein
LVPLALAVDDIPPPFGFHWNDSTTKVEKVLLGCESKIVAKEKKRDEMFGQSEGLVQPGLKRTLFTFQEVFLGEVELQYEYPEWSIERLQRPDGGNSTLYLTENSALESWYPVHEILIPM